MTMKKCMSHKIILIFNNHKHDYFRYAELDKWYEGQPEMPEERRHKRSAINTFNRTFLQSTFNRTIHNFDRKYFNTSGSEIGNSTNINRLIHGAESSLFLFKESLNPWEVIIYNQLKAPCNYNKQIYKDNNPDPDGGNYFICSGTLITNQHILTTAKCLMKNKLFDDNNKRIIQRHSIDGKDHVYQRKIPEYSDEKCLNVVIGHTDRIAALDHPAMFKRVQRKFVHPQAFSHADEYNYNLGHSVM